MTGLEGCIEMKRRADQERDWKATSVSAAGLVSHPTSLIFDFILLIFYSGGV